MTKNTNTRGGKQYPVFSSCTNNIKQPSSSSEVVPGTRGTKTASEPNLPGPRSQRPWTFPPTSIFVLPVSGLACRSNLTIPVTFAMLSSTVPYTYCCFLIAYRERVLIHQFYKLKIQFIQETMERNVGIIQINKKKGILTKEMMTNIILIFYNCNC